MTLTNMTGGTFIPEGMFILYFKVARDGSWSKIDMKKPSFSKIEVFFIVPALKG